LLGPKPPPKDIDTVLTTAMSAASMAAGIVAAYKTPRLRLDPIVVKPEADPANWPTVLGLELGDRVTFQVTPMATGSR
jgi:hypothetical protein